MGLCLLTSTLNALQAVSGSGRDKDRARLTVNRRRAAFQCPPRKLPCVCRLAANDILHQPGRLPQQLPLHKLVNFPEPLAQTGMDRCSKASGRGPCDLSAPGENPSTLRHSCRSVSGGHRPVQGLKHGRASSEGPAFDARPMRFSRSPLATHERNPEIQRNRRNRGGDAAIERPRMDPATWPS